MKIEWTLASKNDYWQNIEYLENHWSEKEVLNFINEIDYSINLNDLHSKYYGNLQKETVALSKMKKTDLVKECRERNLYQIRLSECLQNGYYKTNYHLLFY